MKQVTRFSRNFGTLLFSNSVTLSLVLVLSVGDRHLLTVLLRYRVTHLSGHLPLNLLLYSFAFVLRIVLCDLFVVGSTLIFVLCMAMLFRNMLTLFLWNILTILLGYILTVFLGYLVTHFLRLVVTLSGWDYSSYRFLYIITLGHWYWTTNRLQNCITFLLVLIVPVWNLDSVTLLFVNILAVLLHYLPALLPGHIFTLGVRYLFTHLSRLIPAFLTWFIPTLLLSIHINDAFSFSNSGAHLLSDCITHFISSCVTLLVIYSLALLFLDRSTFLL